MQKFVCVLAVFAIVAAVTFSGVEACSNCNSAGCSGCGVRSLPSLHSIPMPSYYPVPVPEPSYGSRCGCGESYLGHSYLPRQYCGSCLARKSYRLNNNCGCGC